MPTGAVLTAVLTFLGVVVGSLIGWLRELFSQRAPLSEAVSRRVEAAMKVWEAESGHSAAHISELKQQIDLLEDRLGDARRDNLELSGDIANLKQAHESMLRLQEKQGRSPIPEDSALRHKPDEGGEDI